MAIIINPETHWQNSTPPTPITDYGQVVLYGYSETHAAVGNVTGGTVSINDEDMFEQLFMGQTPTLPVSVTVEGNSAQDPWDWQVSAHDANQQEIWIGGDMLSYAVTITPAEEPFTMTFDITSLPGIAVDKSTTTTRTLVSQQEFADLAAIQYSSSILYVLTDVPVVTVKEVVAGELITMVPNSFLQGATNLISVNLTPATGLVDIGDSCLSGCTSINETIVIPDTVSHIGASFMQGCTSYNKPINIPTGLYSPPTSFLNGCTSFNQPITIPNNITSTPSGFLNGCTSFNQPIVLHNGITSIGDSFLYGCTSFNQSITFPTGLTTIGANFLTNCASFNQSITFPTGLTTIGNAFLSGCGLFNQPIAFPYDLAQVGNNFLSNCKAFNQSITFQNRSTFDVGTHFLSGCTSFDQPIVMYNSGTRSLANRFLYGCTSFNSSVTLPPNLSAIGDSFLQGCKAYNQPLTFPTDLRRIGSNFLYGCSAFNKPVAFTNFSDIGSYCFFGCTALNSTITMSNSSGLINIGTGFLEGCTLFNQPITLPTEVRLAYTSYYHFMYNCDSFTSTVTANHDQSTLPGTDFRYWLSTVNSNAPLYRTGCRVTGTNVSSWRYYITADRTSSPYRKITYIT